MLARSDPVAMDDTRIVFLHPKDQWDDYYGSRVEIAVNGKPAEAIAYRGFFFDVTAGDIELQAQRCTLLARVDPGATVFVGVVPSRSYSITTGIAALAGWIAFIGAEPVTSAAGETVASVTGVAVNAAAAECGGAFRLRPVDEKTALKQLEEVAWSETTRKRETIRRSAPVRADTP